MAPRVVATVTPPLISRSATRGALWWRRALVVAWRFLGGNIASAVLWLVVIALSVIVTRLTHGYALAWFVPVLAYLLAAGVSRAFCIGRTGVDRAPPLWVPPPGVNAIAGRRRAL